MNQPPGYPPGGPPQYPGQPGFPPQGQAPQGQQPQGQQPAFGGTMLMPASPQAAQAQAQLAAAQAAAAAAQQPAYGQPPPGMPGAPPGMPGAPPAYGAPPGGAPGFGGPPPAFGQPPPAYGAPPGGAPGFGAPPPGAPPGYGAPPGAPGFGPPPGAPPPQQGMQGPSFGIGGIGPGGIPRIKVGEGDFSPNKLWKAVATGEGYAKPRLAGLLMVGLAVALMIVNVILMFVVHIYYPYFYSLGAIIFWGGLWMVITGQPKADDSGKAPAWGRFGLAGCLVVGILVGIAMIFMNWEAMLVGAALGG